MMCRTPSRRREAACDARPGCRRESDAPAAAAPAAVLEACGKALVVNALALAAPACDLPARAPDATHDVRIATRRTRATLRLFGELLPRSDSRALHRRLARLLRMLGRQRELDVELAALAAIADSAPDWRPATESARRALRRRAPEARREARRALRPKRLRRLRVAVLRLARRAFVVRARLAVNGGTVGDELRPWLHRRLGTEVADWLAARPARGAPLADWHRFRVLSKRLRYALESVHAEGADDLDAAAASCKVVQDTLGALHDDAVLADDLESIAQTYRAAKHEGAATRCAALAHFVRVRGSAYGLADEAIRGAAGALEAAFVEPTRRLPPATRKSP
jgi:CHAD domain-containing protein